MRYAGFSPCFRREAGAAGRDTRGMFRVHQFDKVEMFSFVRPEDSEAEHERLLEIEEAILQALEIPYRVVNIAVDDLGASAPPRSTTARPGCRASSATASSPRPRTRPTSRRAGSTSATGRTAAASRVHAHTLNGTAVAVGRTLIALLENHQREDGTVGVPAVLQQWGAPETLRVGARG